MKKLSIYIIAGAFVLLAITAALLYLHKKSASQDTVDSSADSLHAISASGVSIDKNSDFFIEENPFELGASKSIFKTTSNENHQTNYWVIDEDKQKIYSLMELLPVALPGELDNVEVVRSGSIVLRWSNNSYTYINPQGTYQATPFDSEHEAYVAAGKETPQKIGGLLTNGLAKSELSPKFDETKQLCGYANEKGKWIIEPAFTVCMEFNNKIASVNYFGLKGVIDTNGHWLFEKPKLLNSNLSPKEQLNQDNFPLDEMIYGVINTKGEWIRLPYQNTGVKSVFLHDGYFYDCADENGNPTLPCTKQKLNSNEAPQNVDSIPDMETSAESNNALQAKALNDVWGFVDASDAWIIKPKYQEVSPFSEGVAAVKLNERWHYIDEKDTPLNGDYALAHDFHHGVAWVSSGARWNLINKKEEQVTNKTFIPELDDFIYPLAFAHEANDGALYMIKPTGEMKPSNLRIDSFGKDSALIPVCEVDTDKCGYLDNNGEWAIKPKFKTVSPFVDGYSLVDLASNMIKITHNDIWVYNISFSPSKAFAYVQLDLGDKTVSVLMDTKTEKFFTKADLK